MPTLWVIEQLYVFKDGQLITLVGAVVGGASGALTGYASFSVETSIATIVGTAGVSVTGTHSDVTVKGGGVGGVLVGLAASGIANSAQGYVDRNLPPAAPVAGAFLQPLAGSVVGAIQAASSKALRPAAGGFAGFVGGIVTGVSGAVLRAGNDCDCM